MSPIVAQLMANAKAKAEVMAVKMAELELSTWSEETEADNKKYYGFTDKSLAKRKKELQKVVSKSKK